MIKIIKYISNLLLAISFSMFAIAQNIEIKNDWHYAGILHPAEKVTLQEIHEDGFIIQKTTTFYNKEGFITKIIYDDSLQQIYEPYRDNHRNIYFIYSVNNEEQKSVIKTQWLNTDHVRFDDDDLVIDTVFDDLGRVLRYDLFLDDPIIPIESTQYVYLAPNETLPADSPSNAFITNLEMDVFGNWIKQKEEKYNDKTIIRTRTIEYFP